MERATAALRSALTTLYEERDKVQEAISALEDLLGVDTVKSRPTQPKPTTSSSGSLPEVAAPSPSKTDGNGDDMTIADYAQIFIKEASHRLSTREVVDRLEERGYATDSTNLYNSTYSALRRRSDLFTQTEDKKWILTKGEDDASNSAESPEGQSHPATSEA
jgi:hypothetical protein